MRKGQLDLAATLAVALVSLVVAPGPAVGATVSVVETTVTEDGHTFTVRTVLYDAGVGEANETTISRAGGRIVVADRGATITAGARCTSIGANEAACPAAGLHFVRVLVRDLDDVVVATRVGQTTIDARGGAGDDTIRSGAGQDFLSGGIGDDILAGGAGDDDVLDGGRGADTLRGGPGSDVVDYSRRTNAVRVDFDGRADDGEPGERDTVGTDVEGAYGGAGNDVLLGNLKHNIFGGGRGDDVIRGRGGDDAMHGGPGNDHLFGGAARDLMLAGAGDDVLVGGPGRDALLGDSGRDSLFARDGVADVVEGGSGRDRACIDRRLDHLRQVEIVCRPDGAGLAG